MSDIFTQSGLQTPFQPLPRIKNKPPKYISRVFRWLSPLNKMRIIVPDYIQDLPSFYHHIVSAKADRSISYLRGFVTEQASLNLYCL